MEILLLDNAIDSFEWTLRHLTSFLELDSHFVNPDKSTTYLKQAILSLNNSLELFFKVKISEVNPLLIYKNINSNSLPPVINDYYRKTIKGEISVALYDYVISNSDLHTIDYSKCIELYCSLYSIPAGNHKDFTELNGLRNGLMHLGINDQSEYYIVAGRLARILFFMQNNLLRSLENKYPRIEGLLPEITSIEFTLTSLEDNIWSCIKSEHKELICKDIEKHFNSYELTNYMEDHNIKANFGLTLDIDFMCFSIGMLQNKQDVEIASGYSNAKSNCIIISDSDYKDGPIFGVIELNENLSLPQKFYIARSENGVDIPEFCEQGDFWKEAPFNKQFAYVPYGKEQIIKMLKQIINCT